MVQVKEEGGGAANTGSAVIICGPRGEMLKPIFLPRGESQGTHATFKAEVGMCTVECEFDRNHETIVVYQIESIEDDVIKKIEVCREEDGDNQIAEQFLAAADAAHEKAHHYHCREPHYVAGQEG